MQGVMGLIPGQGANIPHAVQPNQKKIFFIKKKKEIALL